MLSYSQLSSFLFNARDGGILAVEYLKTSEVAKLLCMSESGVRKWEREGRLKALRTATGQRLFRREDVERLMPKESTESIEPDTVKEIQRNGTK